MKKLGIIMLLVALVSPTFVGCQPSKKVEMPAKIEEETAREGEFGKEDAQTAPPLDEEEPK